MDGGGDDALETRSVAAQLFRNPGHPLSVALSEFITAVVAFTSSPNFFYAADGHTLFCPWELRSAEKWSLMLSTPHIHVDPIHRGARRVLMFMGDSFVNTWPDGTDPYSDIGWIRSLPSGPDVRVMYEGDNAASVVVLTDETSSGSEPGATIRESDCTSTLTPEEFIARLGDMLRPVHSNLISAAINTFLITLGDEAAVGVADGVDFDGIDDCHALYRSRLCDLIIDAGHHRRYRLSPIDADFEDDDDFGSYLASTLEVVKLPRATELADPELEGDVMGLFSDLCI